MLVHLTGSKIVMPETSDYMKVHIKEVYSATNNLNEINVIGEGTAGKHLGVLIF